MTCWPSKTSAPGWPVPNPGRCPKLAGLTAGELEQARRELRASLGLARPNSPARGPILARLSAIDAELARRRRVTGAASTMIYLCSCGFGTDDADWFDDHLFQHPGHERRPMMW